MVCPDRRRFRGYDPLLHHDFPVGGKLLPDIAEADTLFGDMIPSYTVCPDRRRFRGYDPLLHHACPVGGKLLPDIAEDDTLFGDMIPSYIMLVL